MNTTEHIKERLKQDLSPGLREALEKALKTHADPDYHGFTIGQEVDFNGTPMIVASWEDWEDRSSNHKKENGIKRGWLPVRFKGNPDGPYVYASRKMKAID